MTTLFMPRTGDSTARYLGMITTIVIALVSLALSAFAAYSRNDKEVSSRVSVIETKQIDDREALKRIEHKLDTLIEYQTGIKP